MKDKPSVLIVEDEIMVAMNLSYLIEDMGFKLAGIAADYESAMKYAEDEFDIALVDCHLRDGITGPKIGSELAEKNNVSVIYITANPQTVIDEYRPHAAILGVCTKPVNDNEIQQLVSFAVAHRLGAPNAIAPAGLKLLAAG